MATRHSNTVYDVLGYHEFVLLLRPAREAVLRVYHCQEKPTPPPCCSETVECTPFRTTIDLLILCFTKEEVKTHLFNLISLLMFYVVFISVLLYTTIGLLLLSPKRQNKILKRNKWVQTDNHAGKKNVICCHYVLFSG